MEPDGIGVHLKLIQDRHYRHRVGPTLKMQPVHHFATDYRTPPTDSWSRSFICPGQARDKLRVRTRRTDFCCAPPGEFSASSRPRSVSVKKAALSSRCGCTALRGGRPREDRLDRAHRFTGNCSPRIRRVDVGMLSFAFVDAVDGHLLDARPIHHIDILFQSRMSRT